MFSTFVKAREVTDKPNVIIVYLDDSGWGDFEHNGNPVIETPTISKLANEGINFTQFYVTSPACSASRYSLLTGRYPSRSGLESWAIGPGNKRYLHPKEVTIAELLKQQGYVTGMFGKWHLGNPNKANTMDPQALPPAHGFDRWIGTNVSHDYRNAKLLRYDGKGNDPIKGYQTLAKNLPSDVKVSESLVGLYAKEAVDFIEKNKNRPFFLYIPHNQPHLRVFASDKFKGKSRRGILGDAMAEVDNSLKRIVEALQKNKIAKNTLVIFSSDNGPWVRYRNEEKNKYGEARMHVGYAAPFRDGKGSNWEGGHRVPGIFWWPGQIAPGRDLRPVSTLDILPTIAKISESKLPNVKMDGRDISSYLKLGASAPTLDFSLAYSGGKNEINALRMGKWKIHTRLISQLGTKHGFEASIKKPLLFNLEEDIGERFDRAKQYPEIVRKLKEAFLQLKTELKESRSYWDK